MEVFIALGANLANRERTIRTAIRRIEELLGAIESCSSIWETEPLLDESASVSSQKKYLNAVLLLKTDFKLPDVLKVLMDIEAQLGRVRGENYVKWGSRTIDLDIIAVGEAVICSENLTIPHPEMHKRVFVLGPLMEIASDWRHPILGETVRELYENMSPSLDPIRYVPKC